MKNFLLIALSLFMTASIFAQSPTFQPVLEKQVYVKNFHQNDKTLDTIWTYMDRGTGFFVYGVAGGGYIFGNNGYYKKTAMNYDGITNASVTEVLLWVGYIHIMNTSDNFTVGVYTATNDTVPGTSLGSGTYAMSSIDTTLAGDGGFTFIPLSAAANTGGNPFFVMLDATMVDDTIGVVCNDPDANNGAGEKRSVLNYGPNWYSVNVMFGGFDADGMYIPVVDIATDANYMEQNGLKIYRPYPNPAQTNCTLTYDLSTAQNVMVKVFGTNGKTVYQDNAFQTNGQHQVDLNVFELSAGTYFYTITTDNATITSKFIVE